MTLAELRGWGGMGCNRRLHTQENICFLRLLYLERICETDTELSEN